MGSLRHCLLRTPCRCRPGGSDLGRVEFVRVLNQLFHPGAVGGENLGDVRLRPFGLAEPPHRVDGILHAQFALVHPLNRARQLRRIKPVEVVALLAVRLRSSPVVVMVPEEDMSKPVPVVKPLAVIC